MPDKMLPRPLSRGRALRLLSMAVLSISSAAVSGCAQTVVVPKPLAIAEVDQRLMQRLRDPRCGTGTDQRVRLHELGAEVACERAGRLHASSRLHALQDAVRVRENAARHAIAAAP